MVLFVWHQTLDLQQVMLPPQLEGQSQKQELWLLAQTCQVEYPDETSPGVVLTWAPQLLDLQHVMQQLLGAQDQMQEMWL